MIELPATLDIPPAWRELLSPSQLAALSGVVLVVGENDTGKSTFARYLFEALRGLGRRVAFLDGDPGQSALGPPTTLTLAYDLDPGKAPVPTGDLRRYFVGSTSPRGHMLQMIVGSGRLVQAGQEAGAQVIIDDTCGLVDPNLGGVALKSAKIELLQPCLVVAFQRELELEHLLLSLRRSQRIRLVVMHPSSAVRRRDPTERRAYRLRQFTRYFAGAQELTVNWQKLAVFPWPVFRLHRLVALEDQAGFTLALGIVTHIDRAARQVKLLTALPSLAGVNALRLGDILLDPVSYQEEKIVV